MIPTHTSVQAVLEATRRLPFDRLDMEMLKAYKTSVAGSTRDVVFHHSMAGAVKEACDNGFIVISCPLLETDFAFAKIDAGRGFFGGQKSRIACYIGTLDLDELMPGSTYKNLGIALSGINNIHRSLEKKLNRAGW